LVGILLGLTLGGGGLGEELQNGTAAFLLARPRRRIHFIRVRWAVAVAQLAVFSIAAPLALFCTLFYCTHHVGSLSFLSVALVFFTYSMLMFALADLITLLRENVRDGVALAVGFTIAWILAAPAINNFFFHRMPMPMRWGFPRSPLWTLLNFPSPRDLLFLPSYGESLWQYFHAPVWPYRFLRTPWILQVAGWLAAAFLFLIPAERVFERKEI
jgi:ABC-type transport system involved in multi-copper enzyme maturation permease subunit